MGYHQIKEYQDVAPTPRAKRELEEFKSIYKDRENKVYDINNVLEEARKNRQEKDELEEKRKLKNQSYNILSNLNKEELEKCRQERLDKVIHPSDDEIRELIDTITSKTLAGDIKAASSLLGDLMATSIMDKVEASDEIPDEEKEEDDDDDSIDEKIDITAIEVAASKEKELAKAEDDETASQDDKTQTQDIEFYSRSMDLSDKDFEMDDEFKERKLPLIVKILIFLIIIVILAAVGYFIWKMK